MTDTIIKGSGNSRSIKSVPNLATLAPTYDKLLELLTGEGLPVDILGLNPAGLDAKGTDLNKSTLLTEATESYLWGYPINATPNDALWQLRSLIATAQNTANGKTAYQTGNFYGTGKSDSTFTLYFSFATRLVLLTSTTLEKLMAICINPSPTGVISTSNTNGYFRVTWGTNNVQISDVGNHFGISAWEYFYIAIG